MSQNAGLNQAWTFITTRDYKMIAILQLRVYYSEKKKTLHFNKIRCIKPRKHRENWLSLSLFSCLSHKRSINLKIFKPEMFLKSL